MPETPVRTTRIPENQWRLITQAAKDEGLTPSEYLRKQAVESASLSLKKRVVAGRAYVAAGITTCAVAVSLTALIV